MTFILVSLVSAAAVFLGLALHRFITAGGGGPKNASATLFSRGYRTWLIGSSVKTVKGISPSKWRASIEGLTFWKYPDLEKWLFAALYGSFVYLAASGFFFAFFVPRGLHGYPLLLHVVAGAFFAVSLTAIVFLRAKNYTPAMTSANLAPPAASPRRLGITAVDVQKAAFWVFALSGFLLAASALFPMLPVFRSGGQKLMFELHRYSALAAVLSGVVFAEMESFNAKRTKN